MAVVAPVGMLKMNISPSDSTIISGSTIGSGADESSTQRENEKGWFRHKYRYLVLILTTLCLTAIFSNVLTLNFTVICVDRRRTGLIRTVPLVDNYTSSMEVGLLKNVSNEHRVWHAHAQYSSFEKTLLQWVVSGAALLATFPFSWLLTNFGARGIFAASGLASAAATAIIPWASDAGLPWFLTARVVQGLAYACDFAVIGVCCTRWASLRENAKFISFLTCFSALASVLTNAASGVICDSTFGWPWVYYFHSALSAVLFIAWAVVYVDDPQESPFVSKKELNTIHRNKSETHINHEAFVPYWAIIKNPVVLTVWLNAFVDLFAAFFLIIYSPTYLKVVLGFSATETGVLGAVEAITNIPAKMVSGFTSDHLHCLPERQKLILYNSIAVFLPAGIFLYLCFDKGTVPLVTVALFGAVHAAMGFNCGGYYKCGALVSRQYAEFVIAFTQLIKCSVFFIAPALVAVFVEEEHRPEQWHSIFYLIAGSLIFANAVFFWFATDAPQPFTEITSRSQKPSKNNKKKTADVTKFTL